MSKKTLKKIKNWFGVAGETFVFSIIWGLGLFVALFTMSFITHLLGMK